MIFQHRQKYFKQHIVHFRTFVEMIAFIGKRLKKVFLKFNKYFHHLTAHSSMKPGKISFSIEKVNEGNINRSPYAYDHDPLSERNTFVD